MLVRKFVHSTGLGAEIEQLPDLAGYAKCAADLHWYRVLFSSNAGH